MLPINNSRDLRAAYEYCGLFETHLRNCIPEHLAPNVNEHLRLLKEQIRAYTHRPARKEILVRDYGCDGYVVRFPLPAWIETEEQANDYFESRYYMECRPSMYDCTGQLFTSWYTCKFWQGRWWAWHSVARDI